MNSAAPLHRERVPDRPHPAVAAAWTQVFRAPHVLRVVPDGCMDVLWTPHGLQVAGPDTGPQLVPGEPGQVYVGVRMRPRYGAHLLGVPAAAVRDARPPLAEFWPAPEVDRLTEQLAATPDPTTAARLLERAVCARFAALGSPDPVLTVLARVVRRTTVAEAADRIGLSERQLRRRCLDAFGYGPKTLQRVLRFQHALRLARGGVPLATVAAEAGYADQAHLAREVRALAGAPLRVLLR
ncbi:MAG TPA: helix-turn-helix transcriptional regulator [Pseudonocardiaceae bacterium]